MKYLLDTNVVSHAIRGQGRVAENLPAHAPSEFGVSSITIAELAFGVEKREAPRLAREVREFLRPIEILPFDEDVAWRYGILGAHLQRTGETIGVLDTMIAAHAMVRDLILVTNNSKHFDRIAGLRWEDWY